MVGGLLAGAAGGATVAIVIQAIDKFSGVFALANKKLLLLSGAMVAVGVAGGFLVGGMVKVAAEFEQTQIAFTTMLGSAEKAQKLLKELADFASKTPFTITGIEASAKQLLAMGIETEDLLPTLKSLGDISAGLNVPLDRLALNFGQVAVQGKLTGRELRDFAVAGVPLIAELAKNLGVAEAEIKEMVTAGDIGFAEVEEAFRTMTSEGGIFFDLMDKQSETLLGVISNIQDSFIKLARIMGEDFLPAAKKVAAGLAIVVGWLEKHPTVAKFIGVTIALISVLLILGGVIIFLNAVTAAFAAINIWWIGIILLVMAAIAGMIAIGVLLAKHWDDLVFKAKVMGVQIGNAFIGMGNIIIKVWNGVVNFIEKSMNRIIRIVNNTIRQMNRVPGINISTISQLSLGAFKADLFERIATPIRLEEAGGALVKEGGTVVNIGVINGMSGKDIADSLQEELEKKISLGV